MAILPVDPLCTLTPLRAVNQMPNNWMKLGRFIFLKGGAYSFWPWNNQQGNRKHPEPWLVFHLASSLETAALLQAVLVEFGWVNGRTLHVKLCQSFNSQAPIMFSFLFNKAHLQSLQAQLVDLLQETLDKMTSQRMINDDDIGQPVPEFNLHVNQPRLPQQANFNNKCFDSFTSQNKCMIHLKCCETAGPLIRALFHYIKDSSQMRRIFGRYVHITEPLTVDASGQNCTLLCQMAQFPYRFPQQCTTTLHHRDS